MAQQADKNKKVKRPTALKRDLQNDKRRLQNRVTRANVKTAVRKYETSLQAKDSDLSRTHLNAVYSVIDKACKKGVYTRNKANRSKARLAARMQG